MNEDTLKHIDKTKQYWYAYAESHYTLVNSIHKEPSETNAEPSEEANAEPSEANAEPSEAKDEPSEEANAEPSEAKDEPSEEANAEPSEAKDEPSENKKRQHNDLDHINKELKYWYAYTESHYL